jgi:hypothetical protein
VKLIDRLRYPAKGEVAVADVGSVKLAGQLRARMSKKPWYVVPIPTRYLNKLRLDANLVFEVLRS